MQTTLELGTLGPVRSDPDYPASQVANAIFGGTFGSRLTLMFGKLKGYTYSPYASLQTYVATGVLTAQADVRNEVTAASFNEMVYELNRMATTSPTEEELATAKRYLVGLEAIRLQIRSSWRENCRAFGFTACLPKRLVKMGRRSRPSLGQMLMPSPRSIFLHATWQLWRSARRRLYAMPLSHLV